MSVSRCGPPWWSLLSVGVLLAAGVVGALVLDTTLVDTLRFGEETGNVFGLAAIELCVEHGVPCCRRLLGTPLVLLDGTGGGSIALIVLLRSSGSSSSISIVIGSSLRVICTLINLVKFSIVVSLILIELVRFRIIVATN